MRLPWVTEEAGEKFFVIIKVLTFLSGENQMKNIGRARASTNVRMGQEHTSKVIEVLRSNDPVDIQDEVGNTLEIISWRLLPPLRGYIQKSAIAKRIPRVKVFSPIELNDGSVLPAAPSDLLAVEFESWLQAKGEPTWLFEDGNAPLLVGDRMRKEFETYRTAWNGWFANVVKNNRTRTANLYEWYTVISGGLEVWSFRPERIFKEPTEQSVALGWVGTNDILHWTGQAHYSEKERKYKLWYEVELTKLDRTIKGWYKADLLEEFVIPEVYVEANDRTGIASLFDMKRTKVRIPEDPEIEEAIIEKRNAPQYIDVQKAFPLTGWVSFGSLERIPPTPLSKYSVTASALRLRSGPGTNYAAIGMLYRNNIVLGNEIVNDWVHVTTADNKTGWSHRGYLELREELPPPVEGEEKYRVNADSLNLRLGPGSNFPEIGSLIKDEIVSRLAATSDGNWVQVQKSAALTRKKVSYNLCGQFCVAALCGVDVIPVVQRWYHSSKRGKAIIEGDKGTIIYDLQEMLTLFNIKSETFQPEPSVAPATPEYLEKNLRAGRKAIIGVGLTTKGEAAYNASIRHWLVISDIVRMGNSGWVRVYNSFFNQEEVYPYQRIFNTGISTGIGLWVEAPDYMPQKSTVVGQPQHELR